MIDRHIVAGSGGFVFRDRQMIVGPLLKYALELSGKQRPKLGLIATAKGDDRTYIASFYNACSQEDIDASHLELFTMPNHDVREYILSQDVIWVCGGSAINLLAVWRAHGLDEILREAWDRGIILAGNSAGSICWFNGGTTDSYGTTLQPVLNGLGFLPYANGVHYDSDTQRRPLLQQLVKEETLPEAYACDDGVSLHFINDTFYQAISDVKGKSAYHVYKTYNNVHEDTIKPVYLNN